MTFAQNQIKELFSNTIEAMKNGLHFSTKESEGEIRWWHDNGMLFQIGFLKNSELEGKLKSWWPNGYIRAEIFYVNGKKNGEEKTWDINCNGCLTRQRFWKEGKEIGEEKIWYNNKLMYDFFYGDKKYTLVRDGKTTSTSLDKLKIKFPEGPWIYE